ncbi:innexin unc-9-like isoform X2 [Watersipora subatra]|uniref:innexin unc-9-like isoform X2 n=1 Tax=Watersipora subatra TaxID=2589382 RepID=UPI00355B6D97
MSAFATFISSVRNGAKLFERRDDDGFDRLSNRYSIGLVLMMAGFVGLRSYTGEPIACIPPAEFTSITWRKWVDNMCWTTNTYYVPDTIPLPEDPSLVHDTSLERYSETIQYYQWSPILLTFCAIMFAAPATVWSWASNSRGYDVNAMVKATSGTTHINPEVRDKTVRYLVAQMDRLLGYRRALPSRSILKKIKVGKRAGSFLIIAYLFSKLLYIANAVGMFYILNAFIGKGYRYYGLDVLRQLRDPDFQGSERFPYGTVCDFWLRRMGDNVQRYTTQCVLPANIFNEMCFLCLWFWLALVAAASILGLLLWVFTLIPAVNRAFARKYLAIMGREAMNDELLREFVHNYLRQDGVFCMRLLIKNTNDAIGGEIFAACWDHFLHSRRQLSRDSTTSLLRTRSTSEDV